MRNIKNIYWILSIFFFLCMGFFVGVGYQYQKDEKVINSILVIEDFFVDSSYQYLEGHRLDLPNEIYSLSWYDDEYIDLMYAFIDDSGDIHIQFTGKQVLRDSLHLDDSCDCPKDSNFIEEHSKLTTEL